MTESHAWITAFCSLLSCRQWIIRIFHDSDVERLIDEELSSLLAKFRARCSDASFPIIDFSQPAANLQSLLMKSLDEHLLEQLIREKNDLRSKSLLLGISTAFAGAWIGAVPRKSNNQHLETALFRLVLRYWLGFPIFASGQKCVCGAPLDIYGDHVLSCNKNGELTLRHNRIRNLLFDFAKTAALSPILEKPGLQDGLQRPADIFLPSFTDENPVIIDVTVVSGMSLAQQFQDQHERGIASIQAEDNKRKRRQVLRNKISTHRGLIRYLPIAAESLGSISQAFRGLLLFFASQWEIQLQIPRNQAFLFMIRKISLEIHRSTAAHFLSVLHRLNLPESCESIMEESFFLSHSEFSSYDDQFAASEFHNQQLIYFMETIKN